MVRDTEVAFTPFDRAASFQSKLNCIGALVPEIEPEEVMEVLFSAVSPQRIQTYSRYKSDFVFENTPVSRYYTGYDRN